MVERVDFADYPLAAKLTDWGIRGHMGFLFGLPNQILLAAIATVLVGIMPLLGISLVGFLVLDVVLGRVRGRGRPVR